MHDKHAEGVAPDAGGPEIGYDEIKRRLRALDPNCYVADINGEIAIDGTFKIVGFCKLFDQFSGR
ncbi:hypothetical protein [Afipia sp. P52-10]|uniref:hypothetical protein n=1 Tax=Afipia sp. P52-10 TaxID=1429916 RepID=UPI001267A3B1|nr:hypothetical protein [Afipia sp. P52-10]